MAWQEIVPGEFTGDPAWDVLSEAAERLTEVYLARFSRPPTLRELHAGLRFVLRPDQIADPEQLGPKHAIAEALQAA